MAGNASNAPTTPTRVRDEIEAADDGEETVWPSPDLPRWSIPRRYRAAIDASRPAIIRPGEDAAPGITAQAAPGITAQAAPGITAQAAPGITAQAAPGITAQGGSTAAASRKKKKGQYNNDDDDAEMMDVDDEPVVASGSANPGPSGAGRDDEEDEEEEETTIGARIRTRNRNKAIVVSSDEEEGEEDEEDEDEEARRAAIRKGKRRAVDVEDEEVVVEEDEEARRAAIRKGKRPARDVEEEEEEEERRQAQEGQGDDDEMDVDAPESPSYFAAAAGALKSLLYGTASAAALPSAFPPVSKAAPAGTVFPQDIALTPAAAAAAAAATTLKFQDPWAASIRASGGPILPWIALGPSLTVAVAPSAPATSAAGAPAPSAPATSATGAPAPAPATTTPMAPPRRPVGRPRKRKAGDDNNDDGQPGPARKNQKQQILCQHCKGLDTATGAARCDFEKISKGHYLECTNCMAHRSTVPGHACKIPRVEQVPWRRYAADAPTNWTPSACDECVRLGQEKICDVDSLLGYSCSHCKNRACLVNGRLTSRRYNGNTHPAVKRQFRRECDCCATQTRDKTGDSGCSWLKDRTAWGKECDHCRVNNLSCVDAGRLLSHPTLLTIPQAWTVSRNPLRLGILDLDGFSEWRRHCRRCLADGHKCKVDAAAAMYACERCTQLGVDCITGDGMLYPILSLARIGTGMHQPFHACARCRIMKRNCDHQRPCDSCVANGESARCDEFSRAAKRTYNCINGRLDPAPGPLYYLAMGYGASGVNNAKDGSRIEDWVGPLAPVFAMHAAGHNPQEHALVAIKLRAMVTPRGVPPHCHWGGPMQGLMPHKIKVADIVAAINACWNAAQPPNGHQAYMTGMAAARRQIADIRSTPNRITVLDDEDDDGDSNPVTGQGNVFTLPRGDGYGGAAVPGSSSSYAYRAGYGYNFSGPYPSAGLLGNGDDDDDSGQQYAPPPMSNDPSVNSNAMMMGMFLNGGTTWRADNDAPTQMVTSGAGGAGGDGEDVDMMDVDVDIDPALVDPAMGADTGVSMLDLLYAPMSPGTAQGFPFGQNMFLPARTVDPSWGDDQQPPSSSQDESQPQL